LTSDTAVDFLKWKRVHKVIGIGTNMVGKFVSPAALNFNVLKVGKHGAAISFCVMEINQLRDLTAAYSHMKTLVHHANLIMQWKSYKILLRMIHAAATAPTGVPALGSLISVIADLFFITRDIKLKESIVAVAQDLQWLAYQEVHKQKKAGIAFKMLKALFVFESVVKVDLKEMIREPRGYVAIARRLALVS
jgi:hypothetical protein